MSERASRFLYPLAIFLLAVALARPAGAEEVKCKDSEIKAPGQILSQADVSDYQGRSSFSLREGVIRPKSSLDIRSSVKQASFNIGQEEVSISTRSGVVLAQGGKDRKLAKGGAGFKTVKLNLASGLDYLLAFPYGYTSSRGVSICYRSGVAQEGRLGSTGIAIYDDDLSGSYDSSDTFSLDGSQVFAPIAELVPSSSDVYRIDKIAPDGSLIACSRYEGDTAKLSIGFSGSSMDLHLAFGGDKLNFACEASGKSLTVIPGEYRILYGYVYSTKTKKVISGVSMGGMEPVKLAANGQEKVSLGKPFELVFQPEPKGNKISISAYMLALKGKAGELYWPLDIVGKPTVAYVVKGKSTPMGSFEYG